MSKFKFNHSQLYEITINPADIKQFAYSDLRGIRCVNYWRDLLKGMNCIYSLRTELSMPQKGNMSHISRIHYHGFIVWKNPSQLYDFFLTDYCKLTQVADVQFNYARPEYWIVYILKMKNYIPENLFKLECIRLPDILNYPPSKSDTDDQVNDKVSCCDSN